MKAINADQEAISLYSLLFAVMQLLQDGY